MDTADLWVAGVISAGIEIVAKDRLPTLTRTGQTLVFRCAKIIIIARSHIGQVNTPRDRIARIVEAGIVVIAGKRTTSHAIAFNALILNGTGVTVIALACVGYVLTTAFFVAAIIGTGIIVCAIGRGSSCTATFEAGVSNSACIAIFTGCAFI